jgi:dienelactone hydrolase
MTRCSLGVLLMSLVLGVPAPADETDDFLKAALAHEVIGPRRTLAETQAYVESRLPEWPDVQTAEEWTREADRLRERTFREVIFRGEAARWRDAATRVEWLDTIEGGPGYRIKKLRFEALPGLWIPALLYEPEHLAGKVPVVLNVNGHDSKGKAAPYKQVRCINQAKRGMLALNLEWFGMGQLATPGNQHGLINAIDLCGTGGIATHYLAMKRGLDVLLSHENADPARVGVTGLSGGGWQTIFFSSLETRVTLTDPVAGYSGFRTRIHHASDLGDSEQTPCDLATVVDYTHLTAMMAPRPTLLTFNQKDDCCFAAPHALPPLVAAAAPVFRLFGREGNLRAHVNFDPGTHNYLLDNRQAFYQITSDFWSTPGQVFNPREIHSDDEVKTAEQLNVELPTDNLDLQKIALALAKDLPTGASRPEGDATADWEEQRRLELRKITRAAGAFTSDLQTATIGTQGGTIASTIRLQIGNCWTIPAIRLEPEKADEKRETLVIVADGGRPEALARARKALEAGSRVVVVDLFYFGEAQFPDHDYLWALMMGTVGDRPLGAQAGQLASMVRWLRRTDAPERLSVVALGPRTSTVALVTAALEVDQIDELELHRPLGSLKQVIEEGRVFSKTPELFCFGLLKSFDLKDIAALVAPRPIRLVEADDRATAELGRFAPAPR